MKQIVGSTLSSDGKHASSENFTSPHPPSYFASLYAKDSLSGGHIIMLGGGGEEACKEALAAYPQGLQIGGGISLSNALSFLSAGASHVIVTSFVFADGEIHMDRLEELVRLVGKQRLVLDLSCRRHFLLLFI